MTEHRYLRVTGLAQGAELRTAMFEDRDHVVVPVVALLGDVVVRPLGSSGPEFVPAEELAIAPGGWNGRPVVPDHPSSGSANEPRTLEAQAFGRLFGSRFEDGKLKTEAWLDPMRAAKVGSDAKRVIERCRAGEQVEVSIGAWVIAEKQEGTAPDGTPYEYRWRSITPDHLALLPEGATGACSNDMGCGAPRAAKGVEEMATLPKVEVEVVTKKRTLRERLRSLFAGDALDFLRFRGAESMSDGDLRHSLDAALFAEEPGYLGIDAVFPDDSTVIYAVAPEQAVTLFRRSFEVDKDGAVSLASEKEAVEPVTRYEPVKAMGAEPVASAAVAPAECSCNDKGDNAAQGDEMEKTKAMVGRLIANERSPFSDADRAYLEGLSETRLSAFEGLLEDAGPLHQAPKSEPAKTEEPKEEQPKPAADPQAVTLSREEYEDMRAAASNFRAQQAQRKGALVAKLKGAQDAYTEQELQAMSVDQVEKLTKALRLDAPTPDYSLRGEPGFTAAGGEDIWRNPPDGYRLNAGKTKEAN